MFELVWLAGIYTSRGVHSSYIELFRYPFACVKYGYKPISADLHDFPLISILEKLEIFPDITQKKGSIVGLLSVGDPACPVFQHMAYDYVMELCGTVTDRAKLGVSAPIVLRAFRETCFDIQNIEQIFQDFGDVNPAVITLSPSESAKI